MGFEFFIGARYLKARQKQAFISLITLLSIAGVTVGVMALIVVIAVMAGFETDLKSRIMGVEAHIIVMKKDGAFTDWAKVVKTAGEIPGVTAATPFVYTQSMLRSAFGVSGAVVRGIDPATAEKVLLNIPAAQLESADQTGQTGQPEKILLGRQLARTLGVVPGDPIYLISPGGMISPVGHMPSMRRFTVAGLFETGMSEYDGSLAYIQMKAAQKMLHLGDRVTGVEVRVADIYQAGKIAGLLLAKIGDKYWARDWTMMNRNLFSALKLEKTVMFIILTLIILVAAFNIASSLIMMVMQKTKDIAILKAMGATGRSIARIFVFKGMIIGAVGTGLGVLFGVVLCELLKKYEFIKLPGDVYMITTLPVRLDVVNILITAGAALLICYLATLYPAHQAARLNPVDAIRYG